MQNAEYSRLFEFEQNDRLPLFVMTLSAMLITIPVIKTSLVNILEHQYVINRYLI